MAHEPQYTPSQNREIYTYNGKNVEFDPAESDSKDLVKWAKDNGCE